ncbi:MAG TPA: hypothetical protein VGM39_01490 [Kofleriaceae bacterium]|jgi:hypothetical protein
MRLGELSLGLAVLVAGGIAHADKAIEPEPEPPAQPEPAPAEPPAPEPEPTFAKQPVGPTAEEIADMTPLPQAPAPKGIDNGFAVGLELTTSAVLTDQLGTSSKLGGAFWFGRRGPTVTWGIGVEFMRASHYDNRNPTMTLDQSYTTIILQPSLSIVFARSKDLHTELLGRFVLGYGASIYDDTDDFNGASEPPDVEIIRFGFGPELRHWVSDAFAIGAHVGPTWEHRGFQNDDGLGTATVTDSAWEIDAAFTMIAVF